MKKIFISLAIVSVLLFSMTLTSAFNPFKWQLCGSANMTAGLCDDYWDLFKTTMGIPDVQNTSSLALNLTGIYNKTEVDALVKSLNSLNQTEIERIVANMVGNSSSAVNLSLIDAQVDAKILPLRDDVANVKQDLQLLTLKNGSDSSSGSFPYIWVVLAVVVLGALWFFGNKQKEKSEASAYERGLAPSVYPKIQNKRQRIGEYDEMQKEIYELKKQMKGPNGREPIKGPPRRKPVEEPEEYEGPGQEEENDNDY